MNITKIKLIELITISILILIIHRLCNKEVIEGLTSNNRLKLKKCLKKIIQRDCTHPLKAMRLNQECEYGENDEYIGITCTNTDLVDKIICSHLIGKGACKCDFGREIIDKSCNRPGVDIRCKMRLRDDKVLLEHIIKFRQKAEKVKELLKEKEEQLSLKIKELEDKTSGLEEEKDTIDSNFKEQRTKIKDIKEMFEKLIEDINEQTKDLEKCEGELTEEKKAELVKLREKLKDGFLSLKDRIKEERKKGFSKERAMGIIQSQKKELLKLKDIEVDDVKKEVEQIEIFNKMMDIRERKEAGEKIDYVQELKDNKGLVGGTLFVIIGIIVGIVLLVIKKKEGTNIATPIK